MHIAFPYPVMSCVSVKEIHCFKESDLYSNIKDSISS
jgi:hypothetical protein